MFARHTSKIIIKHKLIEGPWSPHVDVYYIYTQIEWNEGIMNDQQLVVYNLNE